MDAYELAGMLFGSKRAESGGSVPYETAVGGTAKSSENGLVLVSMSSDVTVPDDYENGTYVEIPTEVNVKDGDYVTVTMSADGSNARVTGVVGGGDRQQKEIDEAGTTATKYITDITDEGVMVHPDGDETTGWRIADALELLKSGVSYIKAWVDNSVPKVRIGAETAGHIVLDHDGISFLDAAADVAHIARRTGGAILSIGRAMLGAGQNAWLQAYTEDNTVTCEVGASHGLDEGSGMVAEVSARAAAGVAQVYASGKSLTVADNYNSSLRGIYNVPMGSFGKLTRCRIDIAFGTLTVAANSRADITLDWAEGGFDDANYIASITQMAFVNGFNNVSCCVSNRTATQVTVSAWNNNSYAVTQLIGVIGVDSRYGTVI